MLQAPPALVETHPTASAVVQVVTPIPSQAGMVRASSGVVVAPGVVATNAHGLRPGLPVTVRSGGRSWSARVRAWDGNRDLGLLEVPGLDLPPVTLAEEIPGEGAPVTALGHPRAGPLRRTTGRFALAWSYDGDVLLQAEVDIAPGSSGGGLFDAEGRLLGLTTFTLNQHPRLAFAVPARWIKASLEAPPQALRMTNVEAVDLTRAFQRRLMSEEGHLEGWLRLTARWVAETPEDPEGWLARAQALHLQLARMPLEASAEKLKACPAVEAAFRKALTLNPKAPGVWSALGGLLDMQGQDAAAESAFLKALEMEPRDGQAWLGLGSVRFNLRRLPAAREALLRAVELEPATGRAWALLAETVLQTEGPAAAVEFWRRAVFLAPMRADWTLAWGEAALHSGDRESAQEALRRLEWLKAPQGAGLRRKLEGRKKR